MDLIRNPNFDQKFSIPRVVAEAMAKLTWDGRPETWFEQVISPCNSMVVVVDSQNWGGVEYRLVFFPTIGVADIQKEFKAIKALERVGWTVANAKLVGEQLLAAHDALKAAALEKEKLSKESSRLLRSKDEAITALKTRLQELEEQGEKEGESGREIIVDQDFDILWKLASSEYFPKGRDEDEYKDEEATVRSAINVALAQGEEAVDKIHRILSNSFYPENFDLLCRMAAKPDSPNALALAWGWTKTKAVKFWKKVKDLTSSFKTPSVPTFFNSVKDLWRTAWSNWEWRAASWKDRILRYPWKNVWGLLKHIPKSFQYTWTACSNLAREDGWWNWLWMVPMSPVLVVTELLAQVIQVPLVVARGLAGEALVYEQGDIVSEDVDTEVEPDF